jgi:small RNA 2'-O-methyltransferase
VRRRVPGGRGRRREEHPEWRLDAAAPVLGQREESTELHEERLDAVVDALTRSGARSVLDLGCGSGSLLRRLVRVGSYERILGVDGSVTALELSRRLLAEEPGAAGTARVKEGSILEPEPEWSAFEAVALVETIEHVPPEQLSRLEHGVFAHVRPSAVVITTPNREFNIHFGLAEGEVRHPDHRFEWDRERFGAWTRGVARRHGYRVDLRGIGPTDALLGAPTQMAVFRRDPA